MKKQILSFTIFLLFGMQMNHVLSQDKLPQKKPTVISLKEAIRKKMLKLRITGSYNLMNNAEKSDNDNTFYGKCMIMTLESNIDSVVQLTLDCGTQLIPEDTTVQTMIVTHKILFQLFPNDKYTTRFYAMCGQMHDFAPVMQTTFTVGELADSSIVKLSCYLGENYIQNLIGQHAMWALTDQAEIDELIRYGADSISVEKTRQILYELDLKTKLTPVIAQSTQVSIQKTEVVNPIIEEPAKVETYEISNRTDYIYAGVGSLLVVTGSLVVFLIRRKKNKEPNA